MIAARSQALRTKGGVAGRRRVRGRSPSADAGEGADGSNGETGDPRAAVERAAPGSPAAPGTPALGDDLRRQHPAASAHWSRKDEWRPPLSPASQAAAFGDLDVAPSEDALAGADAAMETPEVAIIPHGLGDSAHESQHGMAAYASEVGPPGDEARGLQGVGAMLLHQRDAPTACLPGSGSGGARLAPRSSGPDALATGGEFFAASSMPLPSTSSPVGAAAAFAFRFGNGAAHKAMLDGGQGGGIDHASALADLDGTRVRALAVVAGRARQRADERLRGPGPRARRVAIPTFLRHAGRLPRRPPRACHLRDGQLHRRRRTQQPRG